jgi:outer membrane protein assembly factor BamB
MATTPAAVGKKLCMSANDGSLVVLQGSDGTPLWRYQTGGTHLSSPVAVDDVIYVGANDGYVSALRAADGALLWQTFVPGKVTAYSSISLTVSAGNQPEEPAR